jgi:hypothetical protein
MVFIHIPAVQFLLNWSLNTFMSLCRWNEFGELRFVQFITLILINERYSRCSFSVLLCFVQLLHDLNEYSFSFETCGYSNSNRTVFFVGG